MKAKIFSSRKQVNGNIVNFEGGHLLVNDEYSLIFPANTLVVLQHLLTEKYGSAVKEIYYLVGKAQMHSIVKESIKHYKYKKTVYLIKEFVDLLRVFGLGKVEIIRCNIKSRSAILKGVNSPYCKQYRKVHGIQKQPINHFFRGLIAGIFEAVLGDNLIVLETKCISQGKRACVFEVKEINSVGSKLEYQVPKGKVDYKELLKKFQLKFPHPVKNRFRPLDKVARKVIHQHMKFKNGEVFIWGIYAPIILVRTFVLLQHYLIKLFGDDVKTFLYLIGKMQSKMGAAMVMNRFGFKNDINLLKSMTQHSQFCGHGPLTISKIDEKNKKIIFVYESNPIAYVHLKLFSENNHIDYYLRGLVTGITEFFFQEHCLGIETQCISNKDKSCVFEVRRTSGWKIRNGLFKLQMLSDRINENKLGKIMGAKALFAPKKS